MPHSFLWLREYVAISKVFEQLDLITYFYYTQCYNTQELIAIKQTIFVFLIDFIS